MKRFIWVIILLFLTPVVFAASREDVLASLERFSDGGDEAIDYGNNLDVNFVFIAVGVLVIIIGFFILTN